MKKIITLITTLIAVSMLSSCIIVGTEDEPEIIINKSSKSPSTQQQQPEQPTPVVTQPQQQTTTVITTPSTAKHKITCYNNTSYMITDWCVKRENIATYANSTNNRMIAPNGKDTITNLPEGRYQIFFSFDDTYQLQPCNYTGSEEFELREDITYILSERAVSYAVCRSAGAGKEGPVFVLSGSDGSEIELVLE
jgi:hypothetical protein